MTDKIVVAAYGAFLLLGAFMGLKAGSKISLIMGLVSSALVFAGFYLLNTNVKQGFMLLSATSGVLAIVFLMRLLKTQKMMPSGMLLAITVLFLIFCIVRYTKS